MIPTVILCPVCGSDDTEPAIGDSYLCMHCGHLFRVVNNQVRDMDDEEDDDDPDPAA